MKSSRITVEQLTMSENRKPEQGVKLRGAEKVARIPVKVVPTVEVPRKPDWIRVKMTAPEEVQRIKTTLRSQKLHTVCEEAACPNLPECFGGGTATFMIMGDICTRRCPFCDVAHGRPNALDVEGWKRLGFTEKQSQVIVNYRDRQMKGNFKSLEDIKNCFVISKEKFDLLKPFIQIKVLENSIVNQSIKKVESKTDFNNIDINKISYKQLLEFGFEEKESSIFVGFRKKLGGFINEKQILEIYNIDKEKLQQLVHICKLDNSSVQKYTLIDAPEEWLQNHPYFKYSADKIIYYRTTYPDDKKIWKLLKLKPEYEEKMKWYLY